MRKVKGLKYIKFKGAPSSKAQIRVLSESGCRNLEDKTVKAIVEDLTFYQQQTALAEAWLAFVSEVLSKVRATGIVQFLNKFLGWLKRDIEKLVCLFKGHRYMSSYEAYTPEGEGFVYPPFRVLIRKCERCGHLHATELSPKVEEHINCRCDITPFLKVKKNSKKKGGKKK